MLTQETHAGLTVFIRICRTNICEGWVMAPVNAGVETTKKPLSAAPGGGFPVKGTEA